MKVPYRYFAVTLQEDDGRKGVSKSGEAVTKGEKIESTAERGEGVPGRRKR